MLGDASNEVVQVMCEVSDFTVWAAEMRKLSTFNAAHPDLVESKNFAKVDRLLRQF